MKKSIIFFLLLIGSCLTATEKPQIYLCSRLTKEAKEWNNVVTEHLKENFFLFRPQDVNLDHLSGSALDLAAYEEDFKGISGSDLLLVLPEYGRDCAWEIGWFCGNGKPAFAYVEKSGDWMRDAMVKGGLKAVITNSLDLYIHCMMLDVSLKNKIHYIPYREALGEKLIELLGERHRLLKPS